MKKLLILSLVLLLGSLTNTLLAQSENNRNNLKMTINYGGKTIVSELSSLSTTISRYSDYNDLRAKEDTAKSKIKIPADKRGSFYLVLSVKKMDTDLLKLFAKRETRFDGTINITDTYGKNPPTVVKFSKAAFESYSDQFSSAAYNDSYSSAVVTLSCVVLTLNGVEMEQ